MQPLKDLDKRLRKVAAVCGLLVAAEGTVVLFSWIVGWRQLASISEAYIPMAPNSAIMFLLIGSCVAAASLAHERKWLSWFSSITLIFIIGFVLITIFEYIFDSDFGMDHLFFNSYGLFQGLPEGHMSPLTALLLIASAISLLLVINRNLKSGLTNKTAASLAFVVMLGGMVLCIGYLYGTPLLYGETIIPVAFSSSIVFVILGIGLVAAAGADNWLVNIAAGVNTRSRLLRVFLPIITIALIFNGWIDIRYVDPSSGNPAVTESVLALVFAAITGLVVAKFSRSIGDAIDKADNRRWKVEIEMRAERDFARSLIETSPSGIISFDADGRIIFANHRAEEILCLSKKAIEDRTYNDPEWKITDLDAQPMPEEKLPFRMVMDHGVAVYDIRYAIEWPDGRRVMLSINAAPIFQESRKPTGMVAAIEDITFQVAASRNVLREKAFGDTIINSLPGIFYMFSEESGMYRYNLNFREISGYSDDEMLGMEPLEFIVPEDRESVGRVVAEVFGGHFSSVEANMLTKDGIRIPYYFTGYRLEIDEGVFLVGTGIDISRRVAAEEQLRRETLKAQRYLDIAGVMLIDIDSDGTVSLINNKGCEILGYPHDQIVGLNWFDKFIPEQQRETVRMVFGQIMAGEVEPVAYFENQVKCADGKEKTIAWHNTPVRDDSGKINSSFSSGEDITDRKAAEKEVADSAARYRSLFENLSDAAFLADVETGIILETNHQGEVLLGRSRSEIVGMRQTGLHPPGEADKYRKLFEVHIESGATNAFEGEALRKDGTSVPINISSAIMEIGGRQVILGLFSDMSERIAAEKSIRESEERYHSLFDESRDTIFISSPEGRFLDINPAGVELFGYGSRDELLQIDIINDHYLDEEERLRYQELLASQGFVQDYYAELKGKSGKRIIGSITATAVRDDAGRINAYRGSIRDITEQRHLQEQLIQAQKMEGIGRLAGGVAHDFNNFLTAIQGYTDLALTELSADHPAYEDLVEARASSKRAADLTRQLLLFSRRESMNLKPIDLNVEISGLLKLLDRIIGEKYEIVIDLEDGLWQTKADPAHMEQIIMNLVVNARDAMEQGGRILIRTSNAVINEEQASRVAEAHPGKFVCTSVVDTGSGIDPETVLHIFEPFYSTKKAKHGTGLGLSVVYGIVIEHGGWIDVESEPGAGSSFYVYLPAITEISEMATVASKAQYGEFSGHGERLLLVEDEASVRALAEATLSRNGYKVIAAADATEAERLFNEVEGKFDLLFSDVVLPGESGLSLAQHLSKIRPDLPVLLASGYNEEIDQETISRLGFRFLQKPYPIADLLAVLRELLDGSEASRPD